MIVGCGEWGFRNLGLEEHFKIAQKFGFKYLEFGIGGGHRGRLAERPSDEEIAAFRQLGEQYGIRTLYCCLENDFTLSDGSSHHDMLMLTLDQIRAAAACGANRVRLFAGFRLAQTMTEYIWQRMLDALRDCAALADELDLQIAIETHGTIRVNEDGTMSHFHSVTTDRECVERLVRDLPSNVGFNYDPGNLKAVAPEDRGYLLDLINERINYCHLKDWRRQGEGWVACAIGDDDLDYAQLLPQMKYQGVYLIEYEPLADTEQGIHRSLEYLRRVAPGFKFV